MTYWAIQILKTLCLCAFVAMTLSGEKNFAMSKGKSEESEKIAEAKMTPFEQHIKEHADSTVTLEQIRRELSSIKGNLSDEIIKQREERG